MEDRSVPAAAFAPGQVVVQFQPGSGPGSLAAVGASVAEQLAAPDPAGGELDLLSLPAGLSVQDAVTRLQSDPAVQYAEPNYSLTGDSLSDPTDPLYSGGSLWGMESSTTSPANDYGSQAAAAWAAGHVGSQSVYVAVLDEGIDYRHPDLYQNIWVNRQEIPSFVNVAALDLNHDGQLSVGELNDPANAGRLLTDGHIHDLNGDGYIDAGDLLYPVELGGWADGIDGDGNGLVDDIAGWDFDGNDRVTYDGPTTDDHGTHVAGTIGAVGDNGVGVAGVNWNVTLIPAKFIGADGGGTTADAVRAIDYVTTLKLRQGLDVVADNASWGNATYSRALQEAIIRAAKADILFVAAAGNDGDTAGSGDNDTLPSFPANYDSRIGTGTVSGASYDDVISVAALTTSGQLATFSNYGPQTVDIAAPGQHIVSTLPDAGYGSFSGTSMATPHVTGAAALYAATHPGATAEDIRNALLSSATPTPSLAGLIVTGGRLNVAAMLDVPAAGLGSSGPVVRTAPSTGGPSRTLAVGGPADGSATVFAPDASGRYQRAAVVAPFPGFTGDVRTATADVDGDGTEDTVLVTGPGAPVRLAVVSGRDDATLLVPPTDPFGGGFIGGGFVAAADLDGDGRAEIVVTPDQGGGPRVTVFSLLPFGLVRRADFFGIADPDFRGGARAALGDVNHDGTPDLAVAAGFGGGPRVALYDGNTVLGGSPSRLVSDFFAFPGDDATSLRNGVYLAVGDVNGDGYGDLIFGAGPGGAPRVLALSGRQVAAGGVGAAQAAPLANFFVAGNSDDRGGVRVAAKDANGDGVADVVVGSGEEQPSRVRVYPGSGFVGTGEPAGFQDLDPFGRVLTDGVFVG